MSMKWPRILTIVRHGQSARNIAKAKASAEGKKHSFADMVRDPDTPLTREGTLQAKSTGLALHSLDNTPVAEHTPFDVLYYSPYLRTKQTAQGIIEGLRYEPKMVFDDRLREIEFGIFDGLTREGLEAKYPEEVRRREKEGKYW